MTPLGLLRRRLFGVPSPQSVFSQPGFAPEAWQNFSPVATSLVEGYHASLETTNLVDLATRLDALDPALHGFAYEGAGMGLAALDIIAPWKNRIQKLVEGPGAPHIYPIYVGIGLALAKMRRNPETFLLGLDPLLGWVVVDGYGFHEGFFNRQRTVTEHQPPTQLSPFARRVFDQGLGRSIWFSTGAQTHQVAQTIEAFPTSRHGDLWSGVGLASAYAGGTDNNGLETIRKIAEPHRAQLARGAATAAWGRVMAGTIPAHTEVACQVYCNSDATSSAAQLDKARAHLSYHPPYETWRKRTEQQLLTTAT